MTRYRLLEEGEVLIPTDEWIQNGSWKKTLCAGELVPDPTIYGCYRRRQIDVVPINQEPIKTSREIMLAAGFSYEDLLADLSHVHSAEEKRT